MKQAIQILFLFASSAIFSQNTISQITNAETVTFVATSYGCFNAGTNTYKFVKQKNGDRKVTYTVDKANGSKKINSKKYAEFVKNYEESATRFSDPDEKPKCTSSIEYVLSSKKGSSKFVNASCEPQFDPETLLKQLLK